jgi:hypothetical protein
MPVHPTKRAFLNIDSKRLTWWRADCCTEQTVVEFGSVGGFSPGKYRSLLWFRDRFRHCPVPAVALEPAAARPLAVRRQPFEGREAGGSLAHGPTGGRGQSAGRRISKRVPNEPSPQMPRNQRFRTLQKDLGRPRLDTSRTAASESGRNNLRTTMEELDFVSLFRWPCAPIYKIDY